MTTSTTRYALHVPMTDNAGAPINGVHALVRDTLAERFPGFTELDGSGAWLAGPHVVHEPIRVYVVDSSDPVAPDLFRALARRVKTLAAQDAVYVTAQPILTELI